MAEKFPYLAKQINGPIAKNIGLAIDSVYEVDQEFINFLKMLSVDTLYGNWLDQLGLVVGAPRPYQTIPTVEETFMFDSELRLLDGDVHGFSSDQTMTIDGKVVSRSNGGLLDNLIRDVSNFPISDRAYRRYIKSLCAMKRTRSIVAMGGVLKSLLDSSRFAVTFEMEPENGRINDILIELAGGLMDYQSSIEMAFNNTFTLPPFVRVKLYLDFDEKHGKVPIENIIRNITGGSDDFSVTYVEEGATSKVVDFYIVIGDSIKNYEDGIKKSISEYFDGINDYIIHYGPQPVKQPPEQQREPEESQPGAVG